MYFVQYRVAIGYTLCKFETLQEAKEMVESLALQGIREIYVSKEIEMKLTVNVEF
jgi:hypothetical protein